MEGKTVNKMKVNSSKEKPYEIKKNPYKKILLILFFAFTLFNHQFITIYDGSLYFRSFSDNNTSELSTLFDTKIVRYESKTTDDVTTYTVYVYSKGRIYVGENLSSTNFTTIKTAYYLLGVKTTSYTPVDWKVLGVIFLVIICIPNKKVYV